MQEHERIERWLIDGPAQQRTGPHAGAVAGWVGPDGRAEYVYPEITGYYLQWLAWIARRRGVHDALISRADAAQRWLVAWAATDDDPPTRRYLRSSPHDWRNDTVFVFDLAMVLRGLGSAHHVGLIEPNGALIRRLGDLCSALIGADGRFDACVRNPTRTELPQRWSTRRGAFLAKAAAGIKAAHADLPGSLPPSLIDAAERTFVASSDELVASPHAETHPYLYAIEGVLSQPSRAEFATRLPAIAERFTSLMEQAKQIGGVPEIGGGHGQTRLDIVAQALRVSVLLDAHRSGGAADRELRDFLARMLARHVTPDGALPFAVGSSPVELNVWTAMFAEQALALAASRPNDLSDFAAAPRIV